MSIRALLEAPEADFLDKMAALFYNRRYKYLK